MTKGSKHTLEARRKMSEWRKGNPGYWLGKKRPDIVEKIRISKMGNKNRLGKYHTQETKERIRKIKKEITPRGGQSPYWKGDKICYTRLHHWVKKMKGRPKICIDCGVSYVERKIQWTNIDHQYRRDINDFVARCVPCHRVYDNKNNYEQKY